MLRSGGTGCLEERHDMSSIQATRLRKGMLDQARQRPVPRPRAPSRHARQQARLRPGADAEHPHEHARGSEVARGGRRRAGDARRARDAVPVQRRRPLLLHGHVVLRADPHLARGAGRLGRTTSCRDADQRRVLRQRAGRHRAAADRRSRGRGDPPAIKGATASAQVKPATLETGLVVQVPPFVNEGDKIRVNTETGEYQSRV